MEFSYILYYAIILVTAFPVGWLLAYLCKDELVDGRKWFYKIIYVLMGILIIALLFFRNIPVMLSLIYLIIITAISLLKSKNRKFLK